ncbi:hypothetical protein GCM10010156_72920 [Planobispora rosea]|uniref:Uncharacterized protein n=1 Tax=Planobispora rosea TaxID=35762 RepID=A0A8J3SAB1_PLARO|nr:hypothetical protein [Planobispora rosea]GGT04541.1 hypothetical protein GCM10010156_72920 [Planobispora rosea]GIH88896.1 hypothetical protein Pro02_73040 [Planobispora rosea]
MTTPDPIDPLVLQDLLNQDLTNRQIAERLATTAREVVRAKVRHGLTGPTVYDHRAVLPWKLPIEHAMAAPACYLRTLSRYAQGGDAFGGEQAVHEAITWAQTILASGADVAYDPAYTGPGLDGAAHWLLVEPGQIWRLRRVYEQVMDRCAQQER